MIQSTHQIWICDNCNITQAPVDLNKQKCPDNWQIITSTDINGYSTPYAICDNQQTCNKRSLTLDKFPPKSLVDQSAIAVDPETPK